MNQSVEIARNWFLGIIVIVLTGLALRAMQPVLVPVVLALFIALVVSPVERWIATHVPTPTRWLGLLASMIVIIAVFAIFIAALWIGGRRIAQALGGLPGRVDDFIRDAEIDEVAVFGTDLSQLANLLGDRAVTFTSGLLTQGLNGVTSWVVTLALTLFLVFLMLAEAPRWLKKLEAVSDADDHQRWQGAVRLIGLKLRVYLMTRLWLGLVTAALYVLWLWLMGVDLLVVWFLLTFLLSFIPNLGSVLAAVVPVFYAVAVLASQPIWLIALGLIVIEQGMGNLVQPQVQSRQVSLSPVVVLLSVIFFGWLWGAAGALLGVPIMIAVVIGAANIDQVATDRPLVIGHPLERIDDNPPHGRAVINCEYFQVCHTASLLPCEGRILAEIFANLAQQHIGLERLDEVGISAGAHAPFAIIRPLFRREDNHRRRLMIGTAPQGLNQPIPVEIRHIQVGYHQIDWICKSGHLLQCIHAVGRRHDVIAPVLQGEGDKLHDGRRIIHHEDSLAHSVRSYMFTALQIQLVLVAVCFTCFNRSSAREAPAAG